MVTIGDCEICGARCRAGSTKCYSCEQDERKNERFAKKTKVIRQAQKVTLKRQNQLNEYHKLAKEYLEAYPCCEVEGCHLKSVEVHHMGGKENERLLDTDKFFAVCRKHHEEITEHSRKAINDGYSVSRTATLKD